MKTELWAIVASLNLIACAVNAGANHWLMADSTMIGFTVSMAMVALHAIRDFLSWQSKAKPEAEKPQ